MRETEFLVTTAQKKKKNSIRTNYVKQEQTRRNEIADVDYVVIETKQSIPL